MKLKNKEDWKKALANNQDVYGSAIYKYAERWADLMEAQIKKGKTVAGCAGETSREADGEGITGYMYGCAVSILSHCWDYGEELRLWHNLDTQIGDEGEKANESGTVLNPALLNITPRATD